MLKLIYQFQTLNDYTCNNEVQSSKQLAKDIISIDEESTNEKRAKIIWTNYQPYWIKQ